MKEPIACFLEKKPFDPAQIHEYIIGDKYVAIMLNNGLCGICATLGTAVDNKLFSGYRPDLSRPSDRIIINAWLNANYNYGSEIAGMGDIFDTIDFKQPKKIVMVGYFESLFEKFSQAGIEVTVFDLNKESPVLTPKTRFANKVSEADIVILTGTTIFNNTFTEVTGLTHGGASVFLLGPSNILSAEMLGYRNIEVVFGSRFEPYDYDLLRKIKEGNGTRGFLSNLKKVYIASEKFRNEIQRN